MKPLILLTAAALTAQTSLDLSQIKHTTATEYRLLVLDPAGKVRPIRLPSAAQITEQADGTLIMVIATQATDPTRYRLTRSTDGTYALPDARPGMVHRNGLLLAEGEDYTIAGGVLTPREPWAATDKITLHVMGGTAPAVVGRRQ